MLIRSGLFLLLLIPAVFAQERPKPPTPQEAKKNFLALLDRPKIPADVKTHSEKVTTDNMVLEYLSIATEKKADGTIERLPILIARPNKPGKFPVMIVQHGTGGKKESLKNWLEAYVQRDVIAVSIDARYHGERVPGKSGASAYVDAITKAWQTPAGKQIEHPFYFDTCWDLWRLIDFLERRDDVDAKRIGMMGISMGGIQTWLAASVDPRVKVAAPLIGVQSFLWSLENERWHARANTIKLAHEQAAKDLNAPKVNAAVCRALWSKVIPGMLDQFDCPNLLPLFADRWLFIGNGLQDPNCPIDGAKIAIKRAEDAFESAKNSAQLKVVLEDVPHKVTPEMMTETLNWTTAALKK